MGNSGSKGDGEGAKQTERIIVDIDGGENGDGGRMSSLGRKSSASERNRTKQHLDEFYSGRRTLEQVLPERFQGELMGDEIVAGKRSGSSRPSRETRSSTAYRRSIQQRMSTGGGSGSERSFFDDGVVGRKSVDSSLYRLKRKEDREAEILAIEADLEEHLGKEALMETITTKDWVWTAVIFAACIGIMTAIYILGPDVHHYHIYEHLYGVSASVPLYYPLDDHKSMSYVEFHALAGVEFPEGNTGSADLFLEVQPGFCVNECAQLSDFTGLDESHTETKEDGFPLTVHFSTHNFARQYSDGEIPVIRVLTNNNAPLGIQIESSQAANIGRYQVVIAGLILIGLFILIMTDVVHRTLSAFIAMFVAIFFLVLFDKAPDMERIWEHVDQEVIILLLGMMIIVNVLSTTGLFEYLAVKSYEWAGGKVTRLFYILVVLTAVLSAFLDNVTTVLLIAPVTISLALAMKIDPIPILISEALLSNIGGTATQIGDPPNIIIGAALSDFVSFVDFLSNLLPIVLVIGTVSVFILRYWYNKELTADAGFVDIDELRKDYRIRKKLLLIRAGGVFTCVIILFFTEPVHHVGAAWIALLGAVVLMLLSEPHDLHHTLESVEWDLLLFFAALFVAIESLAEMGLINWIGDLIAGWIKSVPEDQQLTVAIVILIWISGIVSGLLDNIPYTTTLVPVIVQLSRDPDLLLPINPLIWSLSLGACLGGNGTLIGASANLVVAGIAGKSGYKISFVDWLKKGPVITFVSLTLAMTYAILRYSVGGDQN
uniref:Citrate transporter-like domain-containing protein n=1 Tax=Timspurckia oligopyrenoides TaxID=708627 RepID=A0A7S0ZAE3_9RHOD|mmetsp:Transcript_10175/g.18320  ORF Transcript_10175/g.18320 Transcript_10175/m.18320 type:complete len:772 (+) Transcript_10175:136-2451(+)|eukprot:CAMPEP_0182441422 /NCGR_PEP_ID=MMETSP1172-20130603/374_1 /TAXON_ID=708627 /ORGANISM="Timspurckia oligopyrenoides, Strain CCMP3278" /LENGTH=771 /DNA_ID=CAMNT_0024635679 /DNA_START=136 /DNA_END=2451 /DNA_ORIENTATION=-